MDRLFIEDYDELSDIMHDEALENKTTYAVLFYDEACELIKGLLCYDDVELSSIDIASGDFNGYFKEYVITLTPDMKLDAEPAWHKDNQYHKAGYLFMGSADAIFIDGDANSSILKSVEGNVYELILSEESDDDDEDEFYDEDFDFVEYLANFIKHASVVQVVLPSSKDCK